MFSNGRLGDAEIWYAVVPAAAAGLVVRAGRALGGYTGFMDVETVAGIDDSKPSGS